MNGSIGTFMTTGFPGIILFAMLIGLWASVGLITAYYGFDLPNSVPWITLTTNAGGPLILLGAAIFAFVRGHKIRQASESDSKTRMEMLAIPCAGLALATVPYWLKLPVPELWVLAAAAAALVWMKRRG